jgi:YidC/Oxa1 family membrane protein insertase
MSENKNLIITMLLSTMILLGWQYFFETPPQVSQEIISEKIDSPIAKLEEKDAEISRTKAISATQRVAINNGVIKGSINLKGLRIDDIALLNYRQELNEQSENVVLLSPANTGESYFAEFGWISNDTSIDLPNEHSIWHANKSHISQNNPITFTWENKQNITFSLTMVLDKNYMFKIKKQVHNYSDKIITLAEYGIINRKFHEVPPSQSILHEGVIGVSKNILYEEAYAKLKPQENIRHNKNHQGDWLGITDKYWLSAIIPQHDFDIKIASDEVSSKHIIQANYIAKSREILPGGSVVEEVYFFVGAKNLTLLDEYAKLYKINLFDRAVDFGWFYFLTKPMFLALQFLDKMIVGNFGIAILCLTVLIKLMMYPLANKSYESMNKMKELAPKLAKLKERCGDDKLRLNKETMELYKTQGINPVSGCLPLFLQIPVFFSLYKVLFVTIEMRHAPFYGWIYDLSAPDPTSIFNLFGLLPFTPPGFLMIGAWPIIMALTMYFQQKMSPPPADPVQAQVMKFLPLIFVFMFASFPAGLVIYWAWNNVLSILQQWVINKKAAKGT